MMNIREFLDTKHGKVIGRVYMLILLFIFNLMIPAGAAMRYLYSMTGMVMYIGIAGTIISILILSTPVKLPE